MTVLPGFHGLGGLDGLGPGPTPGPGGRGGLSGLWGDPGMEKKKSLPVNCYHIICQYHTINILFLLLSSNNVP